MKGNPMKASCKSFTRTLGALLALCILVLAVSSRAQAQGSLLSWGDNSSGRVSNTPAGNDFIAVSAGGNHCVALRSDGSLVTWGSNFVGQLNGLPTGNDFIAISAGGGHSIARRADGSLVSWGSDTYGQVSGTPAGNDFSAIAAGGEFTVALRSDGSLVTWGRDLYGQISQTPTTGTYVAIAAGGNHGVAIRADGSLVTWGDDSFWQVSNTPDGNDFVAVSAGVEYSVALRSDGSLVAWGRNNRGQVSNTPAGNDFIAIAAGSYHCVALRSNGSLVSWGTNNLGPVIPPPATGTYTAVSAGTFYSIALRNQVPLANAGVDQDAAILHDGNPATNTAFITLNGSASSDPNGDALTYVWDDGQGHTSTEANPSFNLPAGKHTFALTVTDRYGEFSTDTVTIAVSAEPNQAPTADSQSVSLNQDTALNITLTGADPDGAQDTLTFTVVSGPTRGTLSGTAPNLTYTPNAGYVGTDSLTFTVTDPYGESLKATVTITVKDTTPPVITLIGPNPITVIQGKPVGEPGATATDNVDGPVPVTESGRVNSAVVGTYTRTYSAKDAAGNIATTTRTFNVVAAPKITVSVQAIGRLGTLVGVLVKVTNAGGVPATNVKITSANLMGVPATLLALYNAFNLDAGKSQEVLLLFCPLSKGQTGTLNVSGTSSLGAFSLSQSATIP